MSRESVRQALVAMVEARKALWTDYSLIIEYDNRILVDTQTQHNPFLCVNLTYFDGEQIDLGSQNHRDHGLLVISAAARENEGTAKAIITSFRRFTRSRWAPCGCGAHALTKSVLISVGSITRLQSHSRLTP